MNSKHLRWIGISAFAGILSFAIITTSCTPPRRNLSTEDKLADMYWLYSQFNENYAPLEYKQERFGFNYAALKQKYLQDAQATKTNDEFYKLMYAFVSEFKDAHTSAAMESPTLPARAKVAYLGFGGKRKGDKLVVTELLPTMKDKNSDFPIKVGDLITKLNGTELKQIVLTEMVKFRNVGQDEANLTFHMNRIFNRVSITNGMPDTENATLTALRDGKEFEVTVPWIVKDLIAFASEQKMASRKNEPATVESNGLREVSPFQIGFFRPDGQLEPTFSAFAKLIRELPTFNFWNTFMFIDDTPAWMVKLKTDTSEGAGEGLTALAKERVVPTGAIPVSVAKTYPTYINREKILGPDGKSTGETKLVAYMHLSSFSTSTPDDKVMEEFKATLAILKDLGVKDLLIDMLNNGGGSLQLGMKMAQALSNTKVVMPEIQFRLSETWLDEFEKNTLFEINDADRELSRRIYDTLKADVAAGKRLSRKLSVEALLGFPLDRNDKLDAPFNTVLMVNEMCASMCDIFTAILKDNGMAKVVGAKTMGAGGNVVDHQMAPNSHLSVRQTESLILRRDGSTYIENNGIDPDVAMNVNESVMDKYEPVHQKALAVLLGSAEVKKSP